MARLLALVGVAIFLSIAWAIATEDRSARSDARSEEMTRLMGDIRAKSAWNTGYLEALKLIISARKARGDPRSCREEFPYAQGKFLEGCLKAYEDAGLVGGRAPV